MIPKPGKAISILFTDAKDKRPMRRSLLIVRDERQVLTTSSRLKRVYYFDCAILYGIHHHHPPINAPTAGA
jgi:hypothetical protein